MKNTTFAIRVSATVTNTDRIVKKKREKTKKRQLTPKSVIYDCGSRKFLTTCSSQFRPRRADAHRFSLLENKLHEFDDPGESAAVPNPQILLSLAQDLPAIWNSPATDMRLKQRIVRILIREIIAEVEEKSREGVLLIHWAGGRHSEVRVKKSETGRSRRCTDPKAIEVIRQMAGKFGDQQIAGTLNRLRLRTGVGNTWNASRVHSARCYYHLPALAQNDQPSEVTLQVAAERLNVSQSIVRRMIEDEDTASASGGGLCAMADSRGRIGFRSDPQTGHRSQESSADSATAELRWAAINVFRETARYSTMSQHRPAAYPPSFVLRCGSDARCGCGPADCFRGRSTSR